jgi:hypothetical protein
VELTPARFISQLSDGRPTHSLSRPSVSPLSLHRTIAIVTPCLCDITLVAAAAAVCPSGPSTLARSSLARACRYIPPSPGERGKLETFQALDNAKRFEPAVPGIVERVLVARSKPKRATSLRFDNILSTTNTLPARLRPRANAPASRAVRRAYVPGPDPVTLFVHTQSPRARCSMRLSPRA